MHWFYIDDEGTVFVFGTDPEKTAAARPEKVKAGNPLKADQTGRIQLPPGHPGHQIKATGEYLGARARGGEGLDRVLQGLGLEQFEGS